MLNTIQNEVDYVFEGKTFESDQHTSLLALCNEFHIKQIFCYRHFISSLKKSAYAYEITKLTGCKSEFDLENAKQLFSKNFVNIVIEDGNELKNINRSLSKVGLSFVFEEKSPIDSFILVNDEEKWEQYSLLKHINLKMPSTTNTLESVHGHLNRKVPRRNSFYMALFRIFTELNHKYLNINESIKNNFNYIKRITNNNLKKRIEMKDIDIMCAFYETNQNSCLCGENKLESANFNVDIPCIHRIHMGVGYPQIPNIEFNFDYSFNQLIVTSEDCIISLLPKDKEKDDFNYAVQTIKFFSNYKTELDIVKFVQSRMPQEKSPFFIQNQNVDLVNLIEEGIFYFKNLVAKT